MAEHDDELALPERLVGQGSLFALTVRDDSMIGAAICAGDLVVVRRQPDAVGGDIVAVEVERGTTVREYRVDPDGRAELVAQNPAYEPLPAGAATILGRVVSVLRRM